FGRQAFARSRSTTSSSTSFLSRMWRYSDIGATPSSAARLRIVSCSYPLVATSSAAASTTWAREIVPQAARRLGSRDPEFTPDSLVLAYAYTRANMGTCTHVELELAGGDSMEDAILALALVLSGGLLAYTTYAALWGLAGALTG